MARGTLYLMLANTLFALVSYVIHFGLGRYLGPGDYGTFGVVLYLMTTVNLFLTSGIPQSAAKYLAEDNARLRAIMGGAGRIQLVFCLLLLALYLGLSGTIAGWLNDASLTPYIRLSALALPTYALYSLYTAGYLNGLRRFGRQALVTTAVSLVKVVLVLLLVLVGLGIDGAIVGYAASALVGFFIAWRFLGTTKSTGISFNWRRLLSFALPATLFAAAFFVLMSVDLFAVKALVNSDDAAGYYTAATTISKVPYYLFAGLAMTLLPSISKSVAAQDGVLTGSYIRQSLRYMLMLLVPGVLLISATAPELLELVYSARYLDAAAPLAILAFGTGLLTIFYVLAHIIMGSGKPWAVLVMALVMVAVSITLNVVLIPEYGLTGAAWATTATGLLGTVAAAVFIIIQFKTLIPPWSLVKILLASLAIYFAALYLPVSFAWLPLLYVGLLAAYIGILIITRELTAADAAVVKGVITPGRFTGGDSVMP